jgi:transcription elongation factor GreA
MSKGDVYLTHEGFEKLRKELEQLQNVKRREISKAIAEARAHGDLSENAEYTYAKEAQALNEKKIAELEDKLSRAKLIDESAMSKDEILIGAKVKLKDLDSGEELEYALVSEEEADYSSCKISVTSPVGEALIGHKENETVQIKVPAGTLRYKIIKITRE